MSDLFRSVFSTDYSLKAYLSDNYLCIIRKRPYWHTVVYSLPDFSELYVLVGRGYGPDERDYTPDQVSIFLSDPDNHDPDTWTPPVLVDLNTGKPLTTVDTRITRPEHYPVILTLNDGYRCTIVTSSPRGETLLRARAPNGDMCFGFFGPCWTFKPLLDCQQFWSLNNEDFRVYGQMLFVRDFSKRQVHLRCNDVSHQWDDAWDYQMVKRSDGYILLIMKNEMMIELYHMSC